MMLHSRRNKDEEGLLRRAVHGDKEAFGELYERYYKSIYRYVYFRVGEQKEAEDLTANVFLKAWEALPGIFVKDFNFRAWIYRISHNLIVDRHRLEKPTISFDGVEEFHDDDGHLENTQVENESIQKLRIMIRSLEPEYQQVVTCRFISGLSHSETARAMNRSEVYVRVLQYRALKKLKSLLTAELKANGRSYRTNDSDLS